MSDEEATMEEQEISAEELREMGQKETYLERGRSRILITLNDVCDMETSLTHYLEGVEASQVEDRDELILSSKGGWIDREGTVRIGAWVLASGSDPLVLRIRMPGLDTAPVVKAYSATLAHDDSWRVVSIRSERIKRR